MPFACHLGTPILSVSTLKKKQKTENFAECIFVKHQRQKFWKFIFANWEDLQFYSNKIRIHKSKFCTF